jgi:LysR family transcriptional regulator, nod-box dependent transcriptional activator
MRFRKLDLNLLVALDVLLAERNVSRASERLNLSQSATSGALAKLRHYFQDELLTPSGRQMVPTPFGASLSRPIRQLLQQIGTTVERRPHFDPGDSDRHFRLMVSDYVTVVLVAEFVRRVHRLAPGIKLDLVPHSDVPHEAIERGDVDFLIIPGTYLNRDHQFETLFTDTYVCVVCANNGHVGEALTWEQYLQLGHIVVRMGRAWMPVFDEWFLAQYGHSRRIEITTSSFINVTQLVAGTDRIATLHRRLASICALQQPVRLLAPPVEFPVVMQVLQWHGRLEHDPAAIWLRTLLLDTARQLT